MTHTENLQRCIARVADAAFVLYEAQAELRRAVSATAGTKDPQLKALQRAATLIMGSDHGRPR